MDNHNSQKFQSLLLLMGFLALQKSGYNILLEFLTQQVKQKKNVTSGHIEPSVASSRLPLPPPKDPCDTGLLGIFQRRWLLAFIQIGPDQIMGRKVSKFVAKTYQILSCGQHQEVLRWSRTGDSFLVLNEEKLANEVLPYYFKHNNTPSFYRQLNMYGFRKEKLSNDVVEFSHQLFKADHEEFLVGIRRKPDSYDVNREDKIISEWEGNKVKFEQNQNEYQNPKSPQQQEKKEEDQEVVKEEEQEAGPIRVMEKLPVPAIPYYFPLYAPQTQGMFFPTFPPAPPDQNSQE